MNEWLKQHCSLFQMCLCPPNLPLCILSVFEASLIELSGQKAFKLNRRGCISFFSFCIHGCVQRLLRVDRKHISQSMPGPWAYNYRMLYLRLCISQIYLVSSLLASRLISTAALCPYQYLSLFCARQIQSCHRSLLSSARHRHPSTGRPDGDRGAGQYHSTISDF